ncbi:MAG: ABC transporter permease [Saprospiraceae bacterium]
MNQTNKNTYWTYVKQQYKQSRRAMISFYIVILLSLVAVFADFLAHDHPIVAKIEGQWHSPLFKSYLVDAGLTKWHKDFLNNNWQTQEYDFVIRSLIPYHPDIPDYSNNYVSPLGKQDVKNWRYRHWFGTESTGRDIAAGMIHGTRVAFKVGFFAMIIATFIGILMGGLAGFFGDNQLKSSRASLYTALFFIPIALFYGIYIRAYPLSDAYAEGLFYFLGQFLISLFIIGLIFLLAWLVAKQLKRFSFLKKAVKLPVDIIISRFIEIFRAIPTLLFILIFVAFFKKASLINIMIIIGLVSWTGIARFIRAELLRIRVLPYIEAAEALGFSKWRTLIRHAIPNALSPVLISIAFGIAASILLEATLSFLELSTTPKTMSWGGILKLSHGLTKEWWLAFFPGLGIFITVTCFNLIGEGLTDALDPKLKK